ncbi:MAG: succinate dehydrogenase, cytochrome b556 subunit [Gammaproteobacteria bacterium TMED95]|jgi:succinate dehydrogenase / fumarate reductase cytochrome b subunit|nr:succinate dehydrogenase, cytochrome b556 subunit [Rhodobiaceae bacterium]MBL6641730.1 succinate dehydrogenase, cytochrome b556 subunit [PS1 clade bacterium]MDB2641886.1 succinate dehydrogenase, cytochrome b556 subunit [Alphaproteobacteria bacterium]OUV19814.1 MAG: succinate dehydrogenase, cytochrome b556 subunit [Gammaproteobacteria bacterium TMED95]RPF95235.1 MAG: succinate dehydrogenase, cytochrome b556 subunit [Rhizobiales bacterium TMED162]|tara:strand:+ start:108 stop:521 length:414 start_codon:yes stop_codon:yes gene_type:complete
MSEHSKPELKARPLSPHIQIYRWTLTMMLSILHRATGVALYAGTALLAWWLLAAASGPDAYATVQAVSSAWYGRLVLFGYTWALFHHMFGGIRHFIWDTGRGFDLKHVEILARITAFTPPVLTLGVWFAAYLYLGAF